MTNDFINELMCYSGPRKGQPHEWRSIGFPYSIDKCQHCHWLRSYMVQQLITQEEREHSKQELRHVVEGASYQQDGLLQTIIKDLTKENNTLREALAFYGLLGNWQGYKNGHTGSCAEYDIGCIAREALGMRPSVDTPGAVRKIKCGDMRCSACGVND